MTGSATQTRFPLIDSVRGFAVFLMIIFHFCYDLNKLSFVKIDFHNDFFWWLFPRIIVFLFLLSMGAALKIAHSPQIRWPKFWKRFAQVAVGALVISGATYIAFPENWIYFGTLHCIATCSLLILPFLKGRYTGLVLFLGLYVPLALGYRFWWWNLPHRSMDYIPAIPWLGVVGLGVFWVQMNWHRFTFKHFSRLQHCLQFLGRHSLIIYLLHQPILFGATYLMHLIIRR